MIPARAKSEQLGAPTFPGRSNWIGIKFGGLLELAERCSTPFFLPDESKSSWRKRLAEIFEIWRFGALFVYLEIPEQIGQTQGAGGYCHRVDWWIL